MKVIAYLGFTLLSVLIQFCVMDLTQEKHNLEIEQVNVNINKNNVTPYTKEKFQELLKTFTQKPHALYYRTQVNSKVQDLNVMSLKKSYENESKQGLDITTISNTIIDEIYDENSSTTEDSFTTESLYSTSEFDNVTEISFFDNKKNQSAVKPGLPKKYKNKDCFCNLLYHVCDINCCCDSDCSDSERRLFVSCSDIPKKKDILDLCYPYMYFSSEQGNMIDNLFCIAKINLPERRNIRPKQYDTTAISHSYKWHTLIRLKHTQFERKPYAYGEPVWVLKEGSIWYIDIPSPTINNYCSGRKPILFLNNINMKCIVNIKDLEMFQILETSKEASCISVTENSINSTALNCSTLHCTNWTFIVCNDMECVGYNKSIHEPFCTEKNCTNLATKLEYFFYYYDSKIVNATIKFYTKNVATNVPYTSQELSVKFILANESFDKIAEMSGNPGYIYGSPVISSFAESNRSLNFFNTTPVARKYLLLPSNKNGLCEVLQTNPQLVLFGLNKRLKCRFVYDKSHSGNNSHICSEIETSIERLLGLNKKTYISPYGNPMEVEDKAWIPIHINLDKKDITYGQFVHKNSNLRCYNMVSRISYVFTFADDVSMKASKKEHKIVSANISVTTQNITFNEEYLSTVLTIDISFIDGTRPRMYEYAAGPYINVRLPQDFFFPFRSGETTINGYRSMVVVLILCNVLANEINFW